MVGCIAFLILISETMCFSEKRNKVISTLEVGCVAGSMGTPLFSFLLEKFSISFSLFYMKLRTSPLVLLVGQILCLIVVTVYL